MKILVWQVECCDNCLFSNVAEDKSYCCLHPEGTVDPETNCAPEIEDGEGLPDWCPLPEEPDFKNVKGQWGLDGPRMMNALKANTKDY